MGSLHNVVRFESGYLLDDSAAKGVFLRWDLSSYSSGWEGWVGGRSGSEFLFSKKIQISTLDSKPVCVVDGCASILQRSSEKKSSYRRTTQRELKALAPE